MREAVYLHSVIQSVSLIISLCSEVVPVLKINPLLMEKCVKWWASLNQSHFIADEALHAFIYVYATFFSQYLSRRKTQSLKQIRTYSSQSQQRKQWHSKYCSDIFFPDKAYIWNLFFCVRKAQMSCTIVILPDISFLWKQHFAWHTRNLN